MNSNENQCQVANHSVGYYVGPSVHPSIHLSIQNTLKKLPEKNHEGRWWALATFQSRQLRTQKI